MRGRASAPVRRPIPSGEVERRGSTAAGELRPGVRVGPGVILYPAIDIRGGRAVRLVRGDYGRETVYDPDPLEAARRWVAQG
ncbi:MAG TPA: HisA/HisF-related TIM barrel protein, partial [Solirubrobacterales bacterium]|nr:HisA/HisF-related TIM barrel protein [Solirubrobacterales bacterium]